VAEAIARHCNLTISALPPTKPGTRNGVVWVPEHMHPDMGVRMMGQAGCDVSLLSSKATDRVAFLPDDPPRPLWIECKNTEAWSFDAGFWRTGITLFVERAMEQAEKAMSLTHFRPIVVLGKNNWPSIVVWRNDESMLRASYHQELDVVMFFDQTWVATPLDSFLRLLVRDISEGDKQWLTRKKVGEATRR
jgi:hypothetical protein